MRKSILPICALVIAIVAIVLVERRTETALRQQNESLRAQLEQLQNANAQFSNSLSQVKSSQTPADEPSRELARLRNEVGQLRQRTNDLARVYEDNRAPQGQPIPAQSQVEPITPEDQFYLDNIHRIDALKQLALAMHVFAGDNNEHFATNFDQLNYVLGGNTNWAGGITFDSFEFMNAGAATPGTPDLIIFREKTPRQTLDGKWIRIYGMADGSVQTRISADGNFDDYEKDRVLPLPAQ